MKVVILAGGYGTRISEESQNKPKPMIELGGYPILWHIMKTYSHYGYNEFVKFVQDISNMQLRNILLIIFFIVQMLHLTLLHQIK